MIQNSRSCKWMLALLMIYVTAAMLASADEPGQRAGDPAIISVIANPKVFDGKMLRLEGYLHCRSEDIAIYPTKEFADNSLTANGLWIGTQQVSSDKLLLSPDNSEAAKLDGHYVAVEARFVAGTSGHLGAFNGRLEAVREIVRIDQRIP